MRPPRIQSAPGMLMAGSRKVHPLDKVFEAIPAQWVAFPFLVPQIPDRLPGPQSGIICQATPGESMEYMCAVEVKSFDNFPKGMGKLNVPPATYAIFTHDGVAADLHQTWRAIWEEWLPKSGYNPANSPDFERYDDTFDPKTGTGGIEIWFPIDKKGRE
ncbi:MAG: GyrI-like domain-containing protein [Pseudomonadota bacterium]